MKQNKFQHTNSMKANSYKLTSTKRTNKKPPAKSAKIRTVRDCEIGYACELDAIDEEEEEE